MPRVEYVAEGEQRSHTEEHCVPEPDVDAHTDGDVFKLKLRCDAKGCLFKGKLLSIRALVLFFSWLCPFLLVQSGVQSKKFRIRPTICIVIFGSVALFWELSALPSSHVENLKAGRPHIPAFSCVCTETLRQGAKQHISLQVENSKP